jgi:hypothetical protein
MRFQRKSVEAASKFWARTARKIRKIRALRQVASFLRYDKIVILHQVIAMTDGGHRFPQSEVIPPEKVEATARMLSSFRTIIGVLAVPVIKLTLRDLEEQVQNHKLTYFAYGQLLIGLSQTLRRELEITKILALDPNRVSCIWT